MKKRRQPWARVLALALAAAMIMPQSMDAAAAAKKKVKLNKKKVVLKVGKKTTLKLKNNKKKVKWSSNKKKVATVTKKGVVKAKKKGTAKITAKVGKKKYVCKVTVKAASTKKSNKNTNGKNNSSKTNGGTQKVTGTPGKNVALNGDIFQIGGRNLTLGMTLAQVHTVLGSLSTDILRSEKSPQGFDVIAFRENGNNSSLSGNQYDQKYSTYILAYLSNDEVIGITAIAPGMSYAGEVSYGTPASTLASNGWTSVDWYLAGSAAGAYTKTIKGTEVIAFVDALGSNQVYCIQAFSDSFLVDDMTKVSETTLQLNYPAEVQTAMATESGELLNAYLVNQGQSAFRINTKLSAAAKSYSSEIVSAGIIDASDASRSSSDIRSSIRAAGIAPGAWGERVLIGNMDAIGFANSMIESSGARALLWSGDYAVMGLGAGAYNDGTVYYPNLVIDLIDKVKLI